MPKLHCVCPKCGSEMAVLAIITNPEEVQKILNHLRKNKSPSFDNKSHPKASHLSFWLIKNQFPEGEACPLFST